ncbi:phenylalanine--tRNA ligase subunit beta [Helicobacter sp. MIT 21-1697]|uniref:phenylalanine--tRNA ligase subunit beta n=1 Tax=Helicobacter sp. MIT 21-1697 TaxID=2993733 RepID=UPI00224B3A1D|nr:phenylalanine--tRNA ligase subunit beta [Helicobacter sp. MIT 21-1697]MCX2716549.1 phenylalanine--tRNA ligase subunit beta [Helicobacter sp. MIT 21-1697]
MIFSKHLLSHFVDISHLDIEQMCIRLSSMGLEVESAYPVEIPQKVVVGKVLSLTPHPDADKLNVCKVSIGSQELQIVCGASNVKAHQYVAVALEGAVIPHTKNGEMVIKQTNLRGVESCGMLCSSTELGLPKINDGIMVLDSTAGKLELGTELSNLSLFNDYVIEVGITPNRGDCLSVLGIARELATSYDLRLKHEVDMDNVITLGLGRVLQILSDEKIEAHLLYRVIEVKQAYLPLDIALCLARNGSLVDDIMCNFLEYGTYMTGVILNAYKLYDCENKDIILDNGLVAQLRIKKDENGLGAVFARQKLSVIGVSYGERHFGTRSEIYIIEASYVNPTLIAKGLYEHGIKGDAQLTYRSTRGSNPNLEQGIDFLCRKMVLVSDALVYSGSHNVIQNIDEITIKTTFKAINQIIGIELDKEEIATILKRLNFKLDATCDENFFMVTVPNYRHDIQSIQDVAEEVLRIYGIDNVSSVPLLCSQSHNINNTYFTYKNTRKLAYGLIAYGFVECIHYVFASSQNLEKLGFMRLDEDLELLNPITNELDTLRTSLLPAMLDSLKRNENLGFKNITLFEIGSVYNAKREEKSKLALVASGCMQDECYPHTKAAKWNLFAFGAICQSCVGDLSFRNIRDEVNAKELLNRFCFADERLLHPYQSAFVYQKDKPIGVIAKLHPQVAINMDLGETFICEIELDMSDFSLSQAYEFSKYQKSTRDLTILIDKDIPFYRVREILMEAQITYVKNIYPIDVYYDKSLGEKMALSIRVVIQSDEGTLQEMQLVQAVESVLGILVREFDASLRT